MWVKELCVTAYNRCNPKAVNAMIFSDPLLTFLIVLLSLVLDRCYGEPARFHPLVGFGRIATAVEQRFNQAPRQQRIGGVLGLVLLVITGLLLIVLPVALLSGWPWLQSVLMVVIVYFCIAPRSLREHAGAIARPLANADIDEARLQLCKIVSRDTAQLNQQQIATAACESVLENGSDGIFAAIFWFVVAGIPGVVIYRMANTLDAMWGYRSERFLYFGWAAARADDLLNWLPARLVAFSYALCGDYRLAIKCWREQAHHWYSPNAGPVMAAGAGSLCIALGGAAVYQRQAKQRPVLGSGEPAAAEDIFRALALLDRGMVLWLAVLLLHALLWMMI